MKRNLALAMSIALAMATGCGDTASSGADMGGGDGSDMNPGGYPGWSEKSPAICGQAPYTWQPAIKVGYTLESARNTIPTFTIEIKGLEGVAFLGSQLNVHHQVNYNVQTAAIRYQTQDRGQLIDATAMVSWPTNGPKQLPVLLFLHPTLGYTDGCAPSKRRSDLTAPMTIFSLIAASAGYVAVFPDYINQKSLGSASTHVTPYLLMEPTALASLDAVRATQDYLKRNETVSASNDLYVWGHSQGAQAVEFVTALQPLYAPEYTIKAAAAVSPPSDLSASARANFAGAAPTYNLGEAVAYAWSDYYDSSQLTTALVPPWDTMALGELQSYCTTNYKDPISSVTDPLKVFTRPFLDAISGNSRLDPWSCWLNYNNPATMGPRMNTSVPMLYVTGDKDTTVIPAANDPVIAKWCTQGLKVEYLQCAGADHTHTIAYSVDDVLNFFDDRQSGKPLPTDTCQAKAPSPCASTP